MEDVFGNRIAVCSYRHDEIEGHTFLISIQVPAMEGKRRYGSKHTYKHVSARERGWMVLPGGEVVKARTGFSMKVLARAVAKAWHESIAEPSEGRDPTADRVTAALEWALQFNGSVIAQMRDKNSRLKRELEDLESENASLRTEIRHLEHELVRFQERLDSAKRRGSAKSVGTYALAVGLTFATTTGSNVASDAITAAITDPPAPAEATAAEVVSFCLAIAQELDPSLAPAIRSLPIVR